MSVQKFKHISNSAARRVQKFANEWASDYWHDYPFGRAPQADLKTYTDLWEAERKKEYPAIDAFEKEQGFSVDDAWFQALAKRTQIVIKDSPLCYQHGRVLYSALRSFLKDRKEPIKIIETGTARGFSAVVMARALQDAKASGQIFTFDILPHHTKMFWNCIDDLTGPKTRAELLKSWIDLVDPYVTFIEGDTRLTLPKVATGRVHFAFLDGAHTYRDVQNEFAQVAARQKAGDVIVFDDYAESVFPGLVQAVNEGCDEMGYEKQIITANDQRAYVIARKKED